MPANDPGGSLLAGDEVHAETSYASIPLGGGEEAEPQAHVELLDASAGGGDGGAQAGHDMSTTPDPGQELVFQVTDRNTGDASLRGTVFNVVNAIAGGGILALPFAVGLNGVVLGPLIIALVGLLAERSALLLFYAADHTNSQLYAEIARKVLGPWAALVVDVTICLKNFGILTGCIVLISDLLPEVLATVTRSAALDASSGLYAVSVLSVALLLPLSALPKLDFLRYSSLLTMLLVSLLTAVLAVLGVLVLRDPSSPAVPDNAATEAAPLFPSGDAPVLKLLQSVPIVFFAMVLHNTCLLLYGELRRQSRHDRPSKWQRKRAKMLAATRAALAFCVLLYVVAGLFGFLIFRSRTDPDILRNFAQSSYPYMVWAKLAMVFVMCFVYPIIAFALRKSLHNLAFGKRHVGDPRFRVAEAAIIVTVTTVLGLASGHNIEVVFGLTGSLAASNIMYIFPAVLFLTLRLRHGLPAEHWGDVPLAAFLLVFGLAVMFGSTAGILVALK